MGIEKCAPVADILCGGGTVVKKKVSDIGEFRNGQYYHHIGQTDDLRDLPDVPVLPATLLRLELKSREHSVDLREISQIVLGDVGASLQIFRYAGRESGSAWDSPGRIEDCISTLGLHGCLEAICRKLLTKSADQAAAIDFWVHSKCIADLCVLLAEEATSGVSREEIYLTGLFHDFSSLPAILGWDWITRASGGQEQLILNIAEAWCLPSFVVGYLREFGAPAVTDRWTRIVERAHSIMSSSQVSIPMGDTICLGCVHVD